jgi:hypothetical protein
VLATDANFQQVATVSNIKRAKRIAEICASALALTVTRQHLGLVLRKKRESRPLLERYLALKASQQPAQPPKNESNN